MTDPLAIMGVFMLGASAGSLASYIKFKGEFSEHHKPGEQISSGTDRIGNPNLNGGRRVLAVCQHLENRTILSHLFREFGVETCSCDSESEALDRLTSEEFGALVLDFDSLPWCQDIAEKVRRISPNRYVATFAIASDSRSRAAASASSCNFAIKQPLESLEVRRLLGSLYGFTPRSSPAYFRLRVELPVSVARASGPLLECRTINLSQNGMAVSTLVSLDPGERLHLIFAIPGTDIVVSAEGLVIWDDRQGKSGIRFDCLSPSMQRRYSKWLQARFSSRVQKDDKTEIEQALPYAQ